MLTMNVPKQSDEALMFDVLSKNKAAFQQLVRRYKNPMMNYFYRQLQHREVSEELTQEVFIRLWKTKKYTDKAKFSTWLYTLAYHILVDHCRKQKRQPPQEQATLTHLTLATPGPTPEQQSLVKDQQAQIQKALKQLPEAQQNILILSKFQDLKHSQIAEILDCPVKRVKVQVFRALKNLTKILKEDINHDKPF